MVRQFGFAELDFWTATKKIKLLEKDIVFRFVSVISLISFFRCIVVEEDPLVSPERVNLS